MNRTRPGLRIGLLCLALIAVAGTGGVTAADAPPAITVKAGRFARKDTPVRWEMSVDRFGPETRRRLEAGPVALAINPVDPASGPSIAQADRVGDGSRVGLTWIMPGELAAGAEARWTIDLDHPAEATSPWAIEREPGGSSRLTRSGRPVFTYNASPVSSPKYQAIQTRDAYIHPAYTPSGALITGDFSSYHPHHRGFFLAYVHTMAGDLSPDFWNIHLGTGKIHADGVDPPINGPVTARFSARHRWEARDKAKGADVVVLRERWDVEAYDIPGSPYWLVDLTSTQQAVGRPMEVLPYRYGGMAYRGPEPFVTGGIDVLTAEGRHRLDGDQKPTRWVDLTGPVAEKSDAYAGAMIADHPSNPHYPNVVRIHPITLPFFSYVPAHDRPLTIATEAPSVFRYRILFHDGRPDKALDERISGDFADPPVIVVERAMD